MEPHSYSSTWSLQGKGAQGQGCQRSSRTYDEYGVCDVSYIYSSVLNNVIISRIAQGGRNWEGFGADPFLSGEAAYETILGMQQGGVQACAKHYINKCV